MAGKDRYNISIKINKTGRGFLDRYKRNRIKQDTDFSGLSYGKLIETIFKYFKENDKNYKELLKVEYNKNV